MNCVNCDKNKSNNNHRNLCEKCNELYERAKIHGQLEETKRMLKENKKRIFYLESDLK